MKTFEIINKTSATKRISIHGESFIIPPKGASLTIQAVELPESIAFLQANNVVIVKEIS